MTVEVLHEDDTLRVLYQQNPTAREDATLISFTGIGHAFAGANVQSGEFHGLGQRFRHVVFVMDLKRSWGNAIDFDRLREIVSSVAGSSDIYAIGNSMGGFLAILAARFLPIKRVVAFAPQFSVNPDVVPFETRWAEHTGGIESWRFKSLAGQVQGDTEVMVFMGPVGPDIEHMKLFRSEPRIKVFKVRGVGHHVARKLKKKGLLHDIVERSFDGKMTQAWINQNADLRSDRGKQTKQRDAKSMPMTQRAVRAFRTRLVPFRAK